MQKKEAGICPNFKPLGASSEDYLKAIYYFSQMTENVRSADIAAHLGVSKPSVHHAMEILQGAGLIVKPLYREISLTECGRRRAQIILCRYNLLKEMLLSLQVDEAIAKQEACQMEHIVSDETLSHLVRHFKEGRTIENNLLCHTYWDEKEKRKCFHIHENECRAC